MNVVKNRAEIAPKYKWNLAPIFETDEKWQECFDNFKTSMEDIKAYAGKLNKSAANLFDCLSTYYELEKTVYRLYFYAMYKHHEDTTDPTNHNMFEKAISLLSNFEAISSFINPEIISIGLVKINEFVSQDNRLDVYKHHFNNLLRKEKHILSSDKEELLENANEVGQSAKKIFEMINNADVSFENVKDIKGAEHKVSPGMYAALMESGDRTLRQNVYESCINAYIKQKNTLAAVYASSVKNCMFNAKVRNYPSTLDASLHENNIPKEIYTNLINTVSDGLPLYHRHLGLRKKCLKYDELHFWDLIVPIVENADTFINWEDAKTTVIEGLGILGEEYQAITKQAFDNGWVDVYENKGKKTGAYCWSAYGMEHPYVLMNYNNTVGNMFTLAHEMGHALHSHYAFSNQPPVYGGYTTFLAETASAVNEILLIEHLLNTTTDKTKHKYLLSYFMQNFESTLFRQTMFAEFEMLAHELAEQNETLNA